MAVGVQVVIDCADPARLGEFWAVALGYERQAPPPGFASWPDFLTAQGVPESEWNSRNAVIDPDGRGPRVFFQRVPEAKVVKNRVHLDLNVGGGPGRPIQERRQKVDAEVKRLEQVGATQQRAVAELGE